MVLLICIVDCYLIALRSTALALAKLQGHAMEIKRRVLIVAIVLEAFFATLSNGLCKYLIALNILYALSKNR